MKLKHLLFLGILVFLNGFVFTVLILMLSRELAQPATPPTPIAIASPTFRPTFTSMPASPSPTPTPEPTATTPPEPTATNTSVIAPATATNTAVLATATNEPATATSTPGAPTATTAPPTATATSEPVATATPTTPPYEFKYEGGMESAPNCGSVYMEGKITGVGGEGVNGRTVRLRFADNVVYRVSGEEGKPPGEWGFSPLAAENYHLPFTFMIDIVESQGSPVPQSDTAEIQFTDCGVAGQFTNIVFAYAW
jgi:hypothetical protein